MKIRDRVIRNERMNSTRPAADPPAGKPPVVLIPPGGERPPRSNHLLLLILCIAGLLILLALAAAVVWYLPRLQQQVASPSLTSPQVENEMETAAPRIDPGTAEAEQLLGEWLRRQAQAEAEHVAAWGGNTYAAILSTAAEADRLLRQRQFTAAAKTYRRAASDLEQLLGSRNDLLLQALARGADALKRLDGEAARIAFAEALAIDPVSEPARLGARRAEHLDQVVALYQAAMQQEKEDNLEEAANLLREALALDNDFSRAAAALGSIESHLADRKFREAMSSALTALDRRDPDGAEKALNEVLQLRPAEPAATDASRRLADLRKVVRLDGLRRKAETASGAEQWPEAMDLYARALAVDPQAAFAAAGKAEAERRLQLDQSIRAVLAAPARLQEDGPLHEAGQLLAAAESISSPGPVLSSQIAELAAMIDRATVKIEVLLGSDNMTVVEIYHVGRFRPFREIRIALRPGSYSVVGRRPGFRDVRRTLNVPADQPDTVPVFTIRCEEPI